MVEEWQREESSRNVNGDSIYLPLDVIQESINDAALRAQKMVEECQGTSLSSLYKNNSLNENGRKLSKSWTRNSALTQNDERRMSKNHRRQKFFWRLSGNFSDNREPLTTSHPDTVLDQRYDRCLMTSIPTYIRPATVQTFSYNYDRAGGFRLWLCSLQRKNMVLSGFRVASLKSITFLECTEDCTSGSRSFPFLRSTVVRNIGTMMKLFRHSPTTMNEQDW